MFRYICSKPPVDDLYADDDEQKQLALQQSKFAALWSLLNWISSTGTGVGRYFGYGAMGSAPDEVIKAALNKRSTSESHAKAIRTKDSLEAKALGLNNQLLGINAQLRSCADSAGNLKPTHRMKAKSLLQTKKQIQSKLDTNAEMLQKILHVIKSLEDMEDIGTMVDAVATANKELKKNKQNLDPEAISVLMADFKRKQEDINKIQSFLSQSDDQTELDNLIIDQEIELNFKQFISEEESDSEESDAFFVNSARSRSEESDKEPLFSLPFESEPAVKQPQLNPSIEGSASNPIYYYPPTLPSPYPGFVPSTEAPILGLETATSYSRPKKAKKAKLNPPTTTTSTTQ